MFVMGFCRLFLAGVVTTWVATEFEDFFFSGVVTWFVGFGDIFFLVLLRCL